MGGGMTKPTRAEVVTTARLLVPNLALQVDKLSDDPMNGDQIRTVAAALKLTLPVLEELQRELRRKTR